MRACPQRDNECWRNSASLHRWPTPGVAPDSPTGAILEGQLDKVLRVVGQACGILAVSINILFVRHFVFLQVSVFNR